MWEFPFLLTFLFPKRVYCSGMTFWICVSICTLLCNPLEDHANIVCIFALVQQMLLYFSFHDTVHILYMTQLIP